MIQILLFPAHPVTWTDGDGVHPVGPFVPGAADELRRSAARQRRASTREAMLRAAVAIERWEREHARATS